MQFRGRDWVVVGSENGVLLLRPLTGISDDVVAVHLGLAERVGRYLPLEKPVPSRFPLPEPQGDYTAASVRLLWQAARLLLREGAAPFRSFGRISVRPRNYQLVPLLMALRLDPVRILIADDVGVGKTIEAGLIVRELWDRKEIQRFAVLCPPYLCDQWQKELQEKFHFEPVVVSTATVNRLQRRAPHGKSIWEHYPVVVISIDFIKTRRNKPLFLEQAPELIVVDEVHGAVPSGGKERHLRYELVRELAADRGRHLLLLTATPHSGIPGAFKKLLGLLDPEFETWDLDAIDEARRARLARHFIQRTRADIKDSWNEGYFPERLHEEYIYRLSPEQWELFRSAHRFCQKIVREGQGLGGFRRRLHYWSALALLRCVMSSPMAAQVAIRKRRRGGAIPEDEGYDPPTMVMEPTDTWGSDEVPATSTMEKIPESEAAALRRLEELAARITPDKDPKLKGCIQKVRELLREGFNPIVWCIYVDTAEYVARELRRALEREFSDLEIRYITGRMGEDERRAMVEELMAKGGAARRVLVATDCLSEGINLQEGFDAVFHYDLPWNPNRLEQREGRVDRFNQKKERVKAVRYYGTDNPVDGAILRVLLRKAWEIYSDLNIYVPVPEDEEAVLEALINALFFGPGHRVAEQLALDFLDEKTKELHKRWDIDARRERKSRSRFAQRRIKPAEVARELEATDGVLGSAKDVRDFVLLLCQRLRMQVERVRRDEDLWRIVLLPEALHGVPEPIRNALPKGRDEWLVSFESPAPAGAEFVGRNHPFVAALAQYLFEEAMSAGKLGGRCGAIRTDRVKRLTSLLLLRVRYLLEEPGRPPLLAEEVLVVGKRYLTEEWLGPGEALGLLAEAEPVANMPVGEKRELLASALAELKPHLEGDGVSPLQLIIGARAEELLEAHKRLRRTIGEAVRGFKVKPHWPPDLLGILVLQPKTDPQGVRDADGHR